MIMTPRLPVLGFHMEDQAGVASGRRPEVCSDGQGRPGDYGLHRGRHQRGRMPNPQMNRGQRRAEADKG